MSSRDVDECIRDTCVCLSTDGHRVGAAQRGAVPGRHRDIRVAELWRRAHQLGHVGRQAQHPGHVHDQERRQGDTPAALLTAMTSYAVRCYQAWCLRHAWPANHAARVFCSRLRCLQAAICFVKKLLEEDWLAAGSLVQLLGELRGRPAAQRRHGLHVDALQPGVAPHRAAARPDQLGRHRPLPQDPGCHGQVRSTFRTGAARLHVGHYNNAALADRRVVGC